jgi:hypothetical protein
MFVVCNAGANTTIVRFLACAQERERVAIVFQIGGGGDNSILWLSFAQQKNVDLFYLISSEE